jgi:hypothetical protein
VPASCPRCGAAVGPGMRACQFCGAPVSIANPEADLPAAETPSAEVPHTDAPQPDAPGIPWQTVPASPAPETPAIPLPEPSSAPPSPAAKPLPFRDAAAQTGLKKRLASVVAPIVVGLLTVAFMYFMIGRLFTTLNGPGSATPSLGNSSAPPASAPSSSGGAVTVNLGVDLYPGAQPLAAPDHVDSSDRTVVSQSFESSDKMDQVINFYKARMVGYTSIYASGNGVVVSINPAPQDFVLVAIEPAPTAGRTRITITHTVTRAAN